VPIYTITIFRTVVVSVNSVKYERDRAKGLRLKPSGYTTHERQARN